VITDFNSKMVDYLH